MYRISNKGRINSLTGKIKLNNFTTLGSTTQSISQAIRVKEQTSNRTRDFGISWRRNSRTLLRSLGQKKGEEGAQSADAITDASERCSIVHDASPRLASSTRATELSITDQVLRNHKRWHKLETRLSWLRWKIWSFIHFDGLRRSAAPQREGRNHCLIGLKLARPRITAGSPPHLAAYV